MILLKRGTIADVVLRSNFKKELEDSGYVLECVNDVTGETGIIEFQNESPHPETYVEAIFNVNQVFSQYDNGFYSFSLYEYRTTPYFRKLLKIGKLKLEGETVQFTEYQDQNNLFVTYGK